MAASTDTARKDADKPAPPRKQVTLHGLKVQINPNVVKDVRVQATLIRAQDPDLAEDPETAAMMLDTFERFFGRAQYKQLLSAIEKENDGIAPIEEVAQAFTKAIKALNPNS